MKLDQLIGDIESCATLQQLEETLQSIINNIGFSDYAFVDVGHPGLDDPFAITTTEKSWDTTYRDNDFIACDPAIPMVRRTNTPFTWDNILLPERRGRRKPAALKCMEASYDHGNRDGLIIPFHFIDSVGRVNSSCCGFFWKDKKSRFLFALKYKRHDLHILMLYWAQKVMDIAATEIHRRPRFTDNEGEEITRNVLTDRERDVLSWAARGRTMSETSTILTISDSTVETHLRHAMHKLGADNKTHAVVRAIYLGLIDV